MVQEVSGRASANAAEPALVANATGAASVSALPGDGQARWEAGSFSVSTTLGHYEIAGWVKPPFALDFRTFDNGDDWIKSGWHLTHLPSGFGMCGIVASLADAKALADEILSIADWSFVDPTAAKDIGPAFSEWRKKAGPKIIRATSVSNPLRCEAQS